MRISSEICRRCCQINELSMPLAYISTHYVNFGKTVSFPKGRCGVTFHTKLDRIKPCLFRVHDTERDGKVPDFLPPYQRCDFLLPYQCLDWREKNRDEKTAESTFKYIDRFDDFHILENCQFYLEQQIMAANQSHIPE